MSNPISSLSDTPENEPALEVDEILDENPPASLASFEADASVREDETSSDPVEAEAEEQTPLAPIEGGARGPAEDGPARGLVVEPGDRAVDHLERRLVAGLGGVGPGE